jgi:amidase
MADWEQKAAKKRQALSDSIPSEWIIPAELLPDESVEDVTKFPETSGWFTSEELAITNSNVLDLLPKLASGELKSETVTRAFCKRAAAAHQLVNTVLTILQQLIAHMKSQNRQIAYRKPAFPAA